jgi:heat shock protein HtpX
MDDRAHCHRNQIKTTLILVVVSVLLVVVGRAVAGRVGLALAIVLALAVNLGAYFWSDRIALRSMRAYPVSEANRPELCRLVRELATTMRLPIPAVYVSPVSTPNAFTTGRNPRRSAICVTEGLLRILDRRELRAVLGHELGHVASRDILVSSVAAALASMILYLARFAWFVEARAARRGRRGRRRPGSVGRVLLVVLGPLAATLLHLAITRSREYAADVTSARVTGDPASLASALRKIDAAVRRTPLPAIPELRSTAALMIANPFREGGLMRLFSTHPPTRDRVARLEALAGLPRRPFR